MKYYKYQLGTNILFGSIEVGGYNSNTGNKEVNDSYCRTADYTPVQSNTDYVIAVNQASIGMFVCQYDINKKYIGRLYPRVNEYFTTDSKCKFVTAYRTNTGQLTQPWQINKGQTILPYEAYNGQWVATSFKKYHNNSWVDAKLYTYFEKWSEYPEYSVGYWERFTITEMQQKTIAELQGGN